MISLREEFADQCHRSWAGWMEYLFSKSTKVGDGDYLIPARLVTRWERQIATDYADLSESEQRSDLDEADKFLDLLNLTGGIEINSMVGVVEIGFRDIGKVIGLAPDEAKKMAKLLMSHAATAEKKVSKNGKYGQS